MKKEQKQGILRRSVPLEDLKAADLLPYGNQMLCLPKLFNTYKELNIKNSILREDIRKCISVVSRIEAQDLRKYQSRKFKAYDQKDIDALSYLINQFEYTVYLDFAEYLSLADREEVRSKDKSLKGVIDKFNIIKKTVKETVNKTKLRPRLYAMEQEGDLASDDQRVRYLFKIGLFDYIQRLIHGERFRPRKCLWCKQWFPANKKNKKTCSPSCKNSNWVKNEGGQLNRKINQKRLSAYRANSYHP